MVDVPEAQKIPFVLFGFLPKLASLIERPSLTRNSDPFMQNTGSDGMSISRIKALFPEVRFYRTTIYLIDVTRFLGMLAEFAAQV